jgi:peptidoglycan/LPS O-acetylase OafA/YrhL
VAAKIARRSTGRGELPGGVSADRDLRLDGLRGLAILLVMLYHTTQYGVARAPLEVAMTVVPSVGWSGVDLFFVLSGFLITGILLEARGRASYFRAFYARRVLRIFPLYYTVLAFFFFVVPNIEIFAAVDHFWYPDAEREQIWFWTYLSNLQVVRAGGWQHQALSITWSLAIEEHFYLFWPAVVWLCGERRLLWVCGLTALGALAVRVALTLGEVGPLDAYVLTPARLDPLATGAALAVVARRPGGLRRLAPAAPWVLAGALLAFGTCYAWIRFGPDALPTTGLSLDQRTAVAMAYLHSPFMQTLGFSLLCLIYGALLVWVTTAPVPALRSRFFETRFLRSLGRYSYAMYLFHFFIALLALAVFTPAAHPTRYVPAQLFYWLLVIGVTWLAARLSWLLLEEPLLRLKRHFPYGVEGGG